MAHHPEPDDSWLSDKPAYPRLYGHYSCEELSQWYDERNLIAYEAMVQAQDRADRQHPDIPGVFVASGMRTPYDARLSRVQLLQLNRHSLFRLSYIRYRRDADL